MYKNFYSLFIEKIKYAQATFGQLMHIREREREKGDWESTSCQKHLNTIKTQRGREDAIDKVTYAVNGFLPK